MRYNLTDRIMGQIARLRYSLPFPASAAFQAGQISIGLRSAYTGCVGEPLGALATGLAHGVVGMCFVLILAADGAVCTKIVNITFWTAHAEPILLSDLTGATGLAADAVRFAAWMKLEISNITRALVATICAFY